MMGHVKADEQLFYDFSIERHVPTDHLLRKIDRILNLSFVHSRLASHYSHTGRPSIDPELMVRILLIGYLYGIRSETRLCDEIHLNLAYRWFCKLGLNGDVPDRSSFSKNRHGRFQQSDIFRSVFEDVVGLCFEAGLVEGASMAVDGSVIEADANPHKRVPGDQVPDAWRGHDQQHLRPVRDYLDSLNTENTEAPVKAPKHLSTTDPSAAWSIKSGPGRFSYETHYLIDTTHAIIVDVEATPARLSQEIIAAQKMIDRVRVRRNIVPDYLAADGSYGTGPFLSWLKKNGVEPHIPVLDRQHQTKGVWSRTHFEFDRIENHFVCPEGKVLRFQGSAYATQTHIYRSNPKECEGCAVREMCTNGKVRTITRNFEEDLRDQVRKLKGTPAFEHSRRMRKKVEMLFAHLKRHLKMTRLRLRGLRGAKEEFLMAATAQNLKRLVKLRAT